MDESTDSVSTDQVVDLVERDETEEAVARLERIAAAPVDERKSALRSLRETVVEHPTTVEPVCATLEPLLEDAERSVRLTAAKLFVAGAGADPDAVVPSVPRLAARLADDEEFYYVRARCAEALGYVALERPDEATSPEILADLRIGLSFDEPEVTEKLAKALEFVALGDPARLRHQVPNLAEHLEDGNELVRYHLTTVLAVIGCEHPEKLEDAVGALAERLRDENAHVRGRAAEALGLLARSDTDLPNAPSEVTPDEEKPFAAERMRFAHNGFAQDAGTAPPDRIGTVEAIRGTTDGIVEEITAPDGDAECPSCGLGLPEEGRPTCPRCGAPY